MTISRRIPTSVGTLALADEGAGVPVICWPSLFADHRFFEPLRDALGEGWRCIRIDGPGFGQSDPPRGEIQPGQYADALVEVMDALDIDRAIVAGCSWGGQVAAHVGVRHPERVLGAVMMNVPMSPSLGGHRMQVIGTRWLGSTRFWGRGVARAMIAPETASAHPERVESFVSAFPSYDSRAAATTVRTTMTQFLGLNDVLPQLRVPAVILMGAEDTLYPVEGALPLARLAPNARIEVIAHCGHLAPLEAPGAVAEAVRSLAADA